MGVQAKQEHPEWAHKLFCVVQAKQTLKPDKIFAQISKCRGIGAGVEQSERLWQVSPLLFTQLLLNFLDPPVGPAWAPPPPRVLKRSLYTLQIFYI
jgi:hypothetical protein